MGDLKVPQGKNKVWVVVSFLNVPHLAQGTGNASFRWIRIKQTSSTTFQTAYQVSIHQGKKFKRTRGTSVDAYNDSELRADMAPCYHDEADI